MIYLIVGVFLTAAIVLSLQQSFKSKKKELHEKISQGWGMPKPKDEYFHFPGIGRYAALEDETGNHFHQLPKQTLYDIDFFGLFAFVDRTTSKVGQQLLFKKLIHRSDSIENEKLTFDFKIKAGQLKTRNAIRLLEMSNYPKDITEEANRLSKSLTDSIKARKD